MSNHSIETAAHRPFAAIYADATARLAATGFPRGEGGAIVAFEVADVTKAALQQSDNSIWILIDDSPITWAQLYGTFSGAFALSGDISPAQITANQNDYNPTGLSGASTLRINSDAARDVTGLQGGSDGRFLVVHNIGSFAITLKDESASSTAANRFALNADCVVGVDQCALLQYDSTSSRWRLVAGPPPSGGDASTASSSFAFTGDISPSQITANQNDYNPTGLSAATTLRLNSDASRNITGLQGGSDGRWLMVHNIGTQNIVLKNEDAGSTAGNRFALNADVTLGANQCALLQYDSTSSRWRLVAGPGGSGGGGNPTSATAEWAWTGDITPSQITSNQNDYNPTGLSTATVLRLSTDAARNITGLAGGADGRLIIIYNVGSNLIRLMNEGTGSTAANRFSLQGTNGGGIGDAAQYINANQMVVLQYDATASRWKVLGNSILQQTAADTITIFNSAAKLIFGTDGQPPRIEYVSSPFGLKMTDAFNSVTLQVRTIQSDSGGNASYYINPDTGILAGAGVKLGFARNSTVGTAGTYFKDVSAQRGLFSVWGDFGSGEVGGTFAFKPERPAQITTNKNDYQTASVSKYIFLNTDASRDITGLKDTQSPSADFAQDGEERVIVNNGSNPIVLKHESASSTAQFRFHNSTGADITLNADEAADLVYDSTLARWRVWKR